MVAFHNWAELPGLPRSPVRETEAECAGFEVKEVGAVEVLVAGPRDACAAILPTGLEPQTLPSPGIETHGPASTIGHNERLATEGHRPLRGNPTDAKSAMGMPRVKIRRARVSPQDVASLCVEALDKRPHKRPDTGTEIDLAILNEHATTSGPLRDDPAVSQDVFLRQTTRLHPLQFSAGCIEAVAVAAVRGEVDLALVDCRGAANRPIGKERPFPFPTCQVECDDFICAVEPDEDGVAHEHRLVGHVDMHPRLRAPCRARCRETHFPLRVQFLRELVLCGMLTLHAMAIRGPVIFAGTGRR